MESMKRVDVLKGIEQILVQKAYETGHISHRADGDWQKTNNGWVRVKSGSAQPTPQAQEPAPAENTEYGEITEEDLAETPEVDLYNADQVDLSGYAHNINIDNGVADNDDLEDVASQILVDNNLEINDENMNKARDAMLSWLDANGYLDSDKEDDIPDGEEDWDRYDDITDMIQNTDWESIVAEYDNPSVDQIMSDYDFPDDERIRDEIAIRIHTEDDNDEDYEQDNEDLDTVDNITDLEEQTPDMAFRNTDNVEKFLESNNIGLDYGASQKFTGYVSELANAYRDGEDINKVLEEFKQRNKLYNNKEAQEGYDTFIKYFNSSPLSSSIQKSAVRDMRSAPATKNMGF